MVQSPIYVAETIKNVIEVMLSRMSQEARIRSGPNLISKLQKLSIPEMSNKKSPGGASIGVSISLVKNILNGRDPAFIRLVLSELSNLL